MKELNSWISRVSIVVFFFCFALCQPIANAQTGDPYLSHYRLPSGVSAQNWDFRQDNNGLMYILNRKAILSFDGISWDNLRVQGRPIALNFHDQLFYTTDLGIGYIKRKSNGTAESTILLNTVGDDFFFKLSNTSQGLLALSPTTVCRIYTDPIGKIDTLYHEVSKEVFFSDGFELNKGFYLVKNRGLIYLIKPDGGLEMLTGLPMGLDLIFSFAHGDKILFGANNSRIYSFDGENLTPLDFKDQPYIRASVLSGGTSVDSVHIALSTVNGGTILVNTVDGSTYSVLNYLNGLPDDEVFSVVMDRNGGLWISHGMGITRADLTLPIKAFGYYGGLKGSFLSAIEHDGKLYVGTSEGLFFLNEKRDYKTVVTTRPRPKTHSSTPIPDLVNAKGVNEIFVEIDTPKHEESFEEKRKGFLSRMFSRRQSDEDSQFYLKEQSDSENRKDSPFPQETVPVRNETNETLPPIRKVHYQLQSITHEYEQVTRIRGKVRQLFVFDGKLHAATNLGLFEIDGDEVKHTIKHKNIIHVEIEGHANAPILVGTDDGAYFLEKRGTSMVLRPILQTENQQIVSLISLSDNRVLLTNEFEILLASRISNGKFEVDRIAIPGAEVGNPIVRWVNGKPMAFSTSGAYVFNCETLALESDSTFNFKMQPDILYNQGGYTWLQSNSRWSVYHSAWESKEVSINLINLLGKPNYIHWANDTTLLVVDNFSKIYRINTAQSAWNDKALSAFLLSVTDKQGIPLVVENLELSYTNNGIQISISAPSFIRADMVQFQYLVSGLMDEWSQWSSSPIIDIPYLPTGKHTILIRAKDILGNMSNTVEFTVTITPPVWQTLWFLALSLLLAIILFSVILKIRERSLRREKELLEQRVKERTQTIEEQNNELKKQRDSLEVYSHEIENQRDEILSQRDYIYKQNWEIFQSIGYAKNIQSAVMPSTEVMQSLFKNHFVFFRPRDIVSGDFYWVTEKEDHLVVVVADCTGHGVPGAFMSMMGLSFLNEIVNVEGCIQPHRILDKLRTKILSSFKTSNSDFQADDGMDMAICVFKNGFRNLEYAGAYNPIYIIRNGELTEIRGDNMPVGRHMNQSDFTLHTIDLYEGDAIYLFSDGYIDQFGGEHNRKFMARSFKQLLISISSQPMDKQEIMLEDTLDRWQGANDQIDDVLVVGIRV